MALRERRVARQRWAVPVTGAGVLLLALLVAGLTSASSQDAQTAAKGGCRGLAKSVRADFKKLDADDSGRISLKEARRAMVSDFKAMDLNRNGVVTIGDVQAEFDRTGGGTANRPLAKYLPYDGNGNGRITKKEYVGKVRKQMFRPMDSSGDGEVRVGEAVSFTTERAPGCG
jgi:Ca2+-binding EF-hand superfamily protein